MSHSDSGSRKPRACKECRQQKLKCDAHLDYSKPCSRCRKSGVSCVFTENFRRRETRSKAAMQREIDNLKKDREQAVAAQRVDFVVPASRPVTGMSQAGVGSSISPGSNTSSTAQVPAYLFNSAPVDVHSTPSSVLSPVPQSIAGIEVDSRKMQDCFALYFKHYHPIVPVLGQGPHYTCSEYLTYSPLLFWTIIVTGARRYTPDPTHLEVLAPKVAQMAALAAIRVPEYFPTISALLILCVWPLPMEQAPEDPSPVYAGIVMQLSLQNGVHMIGRRQDFSQNQMVKDTNQELFRARLWGFCKLVCHW